MKRTITIGFSPCPNDTFIFDALVNKRVETAPYEFEPVLADVEELNHMAVDGRLDISKISVAAYPEVSGNYIILESGAALGKGVGPLVVGREPASDDYFDTATIAIPGQMTTANLLLTEFFPHINRKETMIFSEVEQAVLTGRTDLGLLIHEGRFTYMQKGLICLHDLGVVWENRTRLPLPLGCIAASRKLEYSDRRNIASLIEQSVRFAFADPGQSSAYIRQHAQELQDQVISQHIALYVNEFSIALGAQGRDAIIALLDLGVSHGLLPPYRKPVFN